MEFDTEDQVLSKFKVFVLKAQQVSSATGILWFGAELSCHAAVFPNISMRFLYIDSFNYDTLLLDFGPLCPPHITKS